MIQPVSKLARVVGTGAVALLAFLLAANPLPAQFHPLDVPADSPLWWTLTDALRPEELRAAHQDTQASLDRYLKDLEAGQAQPLTEEQAKQLTFYVNPQRSPDLVPMWYAFDIFAQFRLPREGVESIVQQLGRYEVSEEGKRTVLEIATEHRVEVENAVATLGPLQVEFGRLQLRAVARLDADPNATQVVTEASRRGDVTFLAREGDESEERTRELLAAWNRNPLTEMGERTLPTLKQSLAAADWDALRRYLRVEIAGRTGVRTGPDS